MFRSPWWRGWGGLFALPGIRTAFGISENSRGRWGKMGRTCCFGESAFFRNSMPSWNGELPLVAELLNFCTCHRGRPQLITRKP